MNSHCTHKLTGKEINKEIKLRLHLYIFVYCVVVDTTSIIQREPCLLIWRETSVQNFGWFLRGLVGTVSRPLSPAADDGVEPCTVPRPLTVLSRLSLPFLTHTKKF